MFGARQTLSRRQVHGRPVCQRKAMFKGTAMREGGMQAPAPLFEIHLTRRCNLRCLHCYSRSNPEEKDQLSVETLADAMTDARDQGFKTVSFSGGEPFLHEGLGRLLKHAKSLGMKTTVTSNGMLLNPARLSLVAKYIDVLAISLDGTPVSHDRLRNCVGAFDRMAENLEAVRASKVHFGFVYTLTEQNSDDAEWAAGFALKEGAKFFRLHPLEWAGRAQDTMEDPGPGFVAPAYAALEAERIRKSWGNRLAVQVEAVDRDLLRQFPEKFHAGDRPARWPANLASCVAPLVLEEDGTVVPVRYGFSREYAIGNIRERRLRDTAPEWMAFGYPRFLDLCTRVYAEACQPSDVPFLNWSGTLQARAAVKELVSIA